MVTINTKLGRIKGINKENSTSFLGIPYALPPVGELRWRSPQPAASWTGIFDATSFPNRAFQPPLPEILNAGEIPGEMSEDCLYLNIHTPAADGKQRPVLFWIHGGGYVQGSASDFDPTPFAVKHNIVVVCTNYRLGMLGFLDLSRFGPDYEGSASNGFRDQIAALRWTHKNINEYGGDPEQITICGASSGGGSVLALLAAPSATGLHKKAIAISPAQAADTPPDIITPFAAYYKMDDEGFFAHLNSMSAAEIFKLQTDSGMAGLAAVDGKVVVKNPADAIKDKLNPVPLLTGVTSHEGTLLSPLMGDNPEVLTGLAYAFAPRITGGDTDSYIQFLDKLLPDATPAERMDRVFYDYFRAASLQAAQASSEVGLNAWVYQFEVPTDHPLGPTHASDIAFIFNLFGDPNNPIPAFHDGDDPAILELASIWTDAFARFVKNGDPNGTGLPNWPIYDVKTRSCLVLGDKPTVVDNPDGEAIEVYGLG